MSETLEIRPKEFKMVDGHAVKEPEDYQDPELLYQSLIKRIREYHPSADISMIEKAYRIAVIPAVTFSSLNSILYTSSVSSKRSKPVTT